MRQTVPTANGWEQQQTEEVDEEEGQRHRFNLIVFPEQATS
jgi:hypothetical protein